LINLINTKCDCLIFVYVILALDLIVFENKNKWNAMSKNIKVYEDPQSLAKKFSDELMGVIQSAVNNGKDKTFISISGGSTPVILFNELTKQPYKDGIKWSNVHFFWCDERCVPPDDKESNFGEAKKALFDKIEIPAENLHRIKGENDPKAEAVRYAEEVSKNLPTKNQLPQFDWVWLGMGTDGHTASLFPGKKLDPVYDKISGVAVHPQSGQKRVSLTEGVLNNSKRISFIITGKDKAKTLKEVLAGSDKYPSAKIKPNDGEFDWYLDKAASSFLKE
jgi:6-phosphogluconolactonase